MKVFFSRGVQPDKIQLFSKISFVLEEKDVKCFHFIFDDIEKYLYKKHKRNIIDFRKKINDIDLIKYHKNFSEIEIDEMIRFEKEYNFKIFKINNEKKLKKLVKLFLDVLNFVNINENINMFILWNNNFLFDRVIYFYAKKTNKKIYVMEQGYFRPFTLTFDSKGVNNESSIPRNKEFFEKIIINDKLMKNFLDKPLNAKENKCLLYSCSVYKFYIFKNRIIKLLFGAKYDPNFISKKINIQKIFQKKNKEILIGMGLNNYIFVPFQVETDSQTILNSPKIKKMIELVEVVSEALEKVNGNRKEKIQVIFKTHPMDKSINLKEIVKKVKEYKNIIFITEGNTNELIKNSLMVITINSTVGVEALVEHKSVITLGDAFYNIDGIAENCMEFSKLDDVINKKLEEKMDIELVDKFLYYLRFDYFKEIYWRNPDNESIKKIVDEILYTDKKERENE